MRTRVARLVRVVLDLLFLPVSQLVQDGCFPIDQTYIVHIGDIPIPSHMSISPSLTDRSELRTHHGACHRSSGKGGHVGYAMSFRKSSEGSRAC